MIDEEEIARFRDNIPCPLPRSSCRWVEEGGVAVCGTCGSGYTAANRERLRLMYEKRG